MKNILYAVLIYGAVNMVFSCVSQKRGGASPRQTKREQRLLSRELFLQDFPIPNSAMRVRGEVLNFVNGEGNGKNFRFMTLEVLGFGESFRSFAVQHGEVIEVRSPNNGTHQLNLNEEIIIDIIPMSERVQTLKYQKAILIDIIKMDY